MSKRTYLYSLALLLVLSACSKKPESEPAEQVQTNEPVAEEKKIAQVQTFDLNKIPLSEHVLGAFPYLGLPQGYEFTKNQSQTPEHERVPFWTGTHVEWVEGRLFSGKIQPQQGYEGSFLEIQRNFEALIQSMGGVEITNSSIPKETVDQDYGQFKIDYYQAMGNIYGEPAQTFIIRQADRSIWVHLVKDGENQAGLMILETRPVEQTSDVLKEFPYLSLPRGYEYHRKEESGFARIPVWTGQQFEWVEGRLMASYVTGTRDYKDQASYLEIQKNIDGVVKKLNGVLVTQSIVPQNIAEQLPEDLRMKYNTNYSGITKHPVTTYKVPIHDRELWVQVNYSSHKNAGLMVLETKKIQITAQAITAEEMKKQLDNNDRVRLDINFATNSAEVLPESRGQIDQITQLLKDHPDLALQIHGHTDDIGDVQYNQQLSERRAKSIVQLLTQAGIAPKRLKAQGFGNSQPVADNNTPEGKAKNRRVELIKL